MVKQSTKPVPDWRNYELELFEHFKLEHPNSSVKHDVRLDGYKSGVSRQIDILVEEKLGDRIVRTAIEAKHYSRRIDVKQVESVIGMLEDIQVDRGILITSQGYSKAALRRAFRDDVQLELDICSTDELQLFQSQLAIPYSGSHGVFMLAPLGWIVDGTRVNNAVATLYRRGLTFDQAGLEKEFMYINFWKKISPTNTLDKLIAHQNDEIHKRFPHAKTEFKYIDLDHNRRGAIRVHENELYPAIEVTGYAEYDDFILFAVMFTPEITMDRNIRKLDYLLRKALPITVKHDSGAEDRSNNFINGGQ